MSSRLSLLRNAEIQRFERHPLARPVSPPKLGAVLLALTFLGALIWSYRGAQVDVARLVDGLPFLWRYVRGFFPPDFSATSDIVRSAIETVQISIIGTTLAVILSIPLGLLAARNIAPHPLIYGSTRMLLNANRSLPDLAIALMFVAAVGLGPFPGTLAIAVGSVGFMGKLFAEAIEQINPRPVEAVRATGAGRLQVIRYAVLPQALPLIASYSLFLWEINVRSATILGLVGAGGIGQDLQTAMRLFLYGELSVIIIVIVVMVTIIDRVSAFLRARLT